MQSLHQKKEIGKRIFELRTQRNLSQEEFGKIIGLSKSGISNIENGNRELTERNIKLIASLFQVNEEWIKTGDSLSFQVIKLETFIDYLKSLGFHIEVQQISETDAEYLIQNNIVNAKFNQSEFEELMKRNEESIEGYILLKASRK